MRRVKRAIFLAGLAASFYAPAELVRLIVSFNRWDWYFQVELGLVGLGVAAQALACRWAARQVLQ